MSPSLSDVQARFEDLVSSAPIPAAAVPVAQVQLCDVAKRGFHLDVQVRPSQVVEAAALMNVLGFCLELVTGVDWLVVTPAVPAPASATPEALAPAASEMEVVYDYFHFHTCCRVAVRTRVPRADPKVPTVRNIYAGADWHERETHEFLGIVFEGHPNLTPLLLPEDATFHPLRKDFAGA